MLALPVIKNLTYGGFPPFPRCDCGNSRFPKGNPCKLDPNKKPLNEDNKYEAAFHLLLSFVDQPLPFCPLPRYNQNFSGVYCTCGRPYPDPEDPVEDEMIQCVVCEDWYHGRHLGLGTKEEGEKKPLDLPLPRGADYAEMVCAGCASVHPWLEGYSDLDCRHKGKEDEEVDVEGKGKEDECPAERVREEGAAGRTFFFVSGWRERLCKCGKCGARYKEEEVEFLLVSLIYTHPKSPT